MGVEFNNFSVRKLLHATVRVGLFGYYSDRLLGKRK